MIKKSTKRPARPYAVREKRSFLCNGFYKSSNNPHMVWYWYWEGMTQPDGSIDAQIDKREILVHGKRIDPLHFLDQYCHC